MRESDIMHQAGPFWVGRQSQGYTVFRDGLTHATSDSTYPRDADGLSLAIARCDYLAKSAKPARTVTITDKDRVIWTGSYAEFQRANIDSLSVSEFCVLETEGTITIGGGAAPLLMIACDSPLSRVARANPPTDQ